MNRDQNMMADDDAMGPKSVCKSGRASVMTCMSVCFRASECVFDECVYFGDGC